MSYVVEAGASRSRRARRRRALITLGIVALMLFFAFWYAYSYYQNSNSSRAAASPSCTATATATATAKTPSQVTVNVYNATDRAGLAAKTASDVRKRGFKVSTVSNDPLQKDVTGAAEVRYGTTGTASAKLVMALVTGSKAIKDSRPDASVDLVLGAKFKALTAPPKPVVATTPSTSAC
ncbi:MAG: LytR C-terminal domain-containing protein [Pedococcus sp.]